MTSRIVCKVGGALLDDQQAASDFIKTLGEIRTTSQVVLVHGGGNGVERLLSQLNIQSQKLNGLRVSPPEHMPYVTGALAGTTNKQLCAYAYEAGIKAVGLTLFDGEMVRCHQTDPQLGSVGTPIANDPSLLESLLNAQLLPIVSSIGCNVDGSLLNVNADQAATAIAQLLNADLYLLSDVDGVMDETKTVLPSLDFSNIDALIAQGTIRDGMQVKVKAAQTAADSLQRPVTIGSWAKLDALKAAVSPNSQARFGTQITANGTI